MFSKYFLCTECTQNFKSWARPCTIHTALVHYFPIWVHTLYSFLKRLFYRFPTFLSFTIHTRTSFSNKIRITYSVAPAGMSFAEDEEASLRYVIKENTALRDPSDAHSASNPVPSGSVLQTGENADDDDGDEKELDSEAVDESSVHKLFGNKEKKTISKLPVSSVSGLNAKVGASAATLSTLTKTMAAPAQSKPQLWAVPGPSTSSTGTSLPSSQQPVKRFAWMPPQFTHLGKFSKTVSFTTSELVRHLINLR